MQLRGMQMQSTRKHAHPEEQHNGVSVQACRCLVVASSVLLLHQLVLLGLRLGSLLLATLGLLLLNSLIVVVVPLVCSSLAFATLLGRATLAFSGLALL
jgi:hypothetical protein